MLMYNHVKSMEFTDQQLWTHVMAATPLLTWRKETSNHWNRHEHIPGIHKDLQFPLSQMKLLEGMTSIGCGVVVMNIYPSQNCCFFPSGFRTLQRTFHNLWSTPDASMEIHEVYYIYQTKQKKQVIAVIADSIIYPMKIDDDTFRNIEKSEGRPRAA